MKTLTTIRKSEPASQKHGAHRTNPTKRTILFLLTALCSCSLLAQLQIKGRVVDAETGEPLPYANVYADDKNGTLTNADGYFHLLTSEGARVRFTYIGYQQMTRPAQQAQGTLRMKPLSRDLDQVTVRPYDPAELVREIIRKLDESYKKGRGERGLYFYRTTFTNGKRNELVEAFMKANSAVNLRKMAITSGVTGSDITDDNARLGITYTNVHRVMQVGARTYDSYRWESCIKPFDKVSVFKRHYEAKAISLGQGEEEIIRIDFKEKPGSPDRKGKGLMVGTAYVRAADKCLLRFDGNVLYQFMQAGLSRVPEEIKFSMQYDYSRGFAELSSLSIEGGGEFQPNVLSHLSTLRYRTILFHIPNDSLERQKEYRLETDMMAAVQKAGYDSQLWNRYEVIRRTEKEERIVFGENLMAHRRTKAKDGQDYIPHMDSTENPRLSELLQRHKRFATLIPQEKLYVHMDNTCYFQGDTIWFAAYTRKTNTDRPSDMSKVLYVELLNHDGYLVERKMLKITDGRADGFFALNQNHAYSGYYELRAYTRWQLNWGVTERPHSLRSRRWFISEEAERNFFRDYEKLYSRVFPVFDRPDTAGDHTPRMTLRPLRRPAYRREGESPLRLTLYPEGGNLVQGLPCRVAFEACRENGEWVEGTLSLVENDVQTGHAIATQHRGRGSFSITPGADKAQRVQFTSKDGERVTATLPRAESSGASLNVVRQGADWTMHCRLSADIQPSAVGLTVSYEGKVLGFYTFRGNNERFTFEPPQGISGVYQATLFTEDGKVLADRLFFHRTPGMAVAPLQVEGLKAEYAPYDSIRISLQSKDVLHNTPFSLAVRESGTSMGNHDTGNILTEMLLASEIRGFVPDPGWYFEQDDSVHHTALDLLMMTQGWRRFRWEDMAVKGALEQTQPREKQLMLKGRVYPSNPADPRLRELEDQSRVLQSASENNEKARQEREKRQKELRDWAGADPKIQQLQDESDRWEKARLTAERDRFFLQKQKSGRKRDSLQNDYNLEYYLHAMLQDGDKKYPFEDMRTHKQGTFEAVIPDFYGECILYLAATPLKRYNPYRQFEWKEMRDPENLTPKELAKSIVAPSPSLVLVDQPYPRFVKPYSYYQERLPQPEWKGPINPEQEEDVTELPELSVKAKFKGQYRFNDRNPAFMLNHMDALNATIDAGLYYAPNIQMKTVLGDMGMETIKGEEWELADFLSDRGKGIARPVIRHRLGATADRRTTASGHEVPADSLYSSEHLESTSADAFISDGELRQYIGLGAIDKTVYYTDYSPRFSGSQQYKNDFPEVNIVHYPHANGGQYPVYADRCLRLPGFALPAEFYSPDYSKQTPPDSAKDYRRTLYWNPNVTLDKDGKATITLYNNARTNQISVDAQGQAADGTLLWEIEQ